MMIHSDHWNQGYCTEALIAFVQALFEKRPEWEEVTCRVCADNIAARRVLEKCSFLPEDLREASVATNRQWVSHTDERELKKSVKLLAFKMGFSPEEVPPMNDDMSDVLARDENESRIIIYRLEKVDFTDGTGMELDQ
jgi:hypothetical protein